jgi:tRNA(fMet)-specific endonuclease VapC
MRRYLLDTGTAGDYIHHRGGVRARALLRKAAGDRIGICAPVLGELWAGIELSATQQRNRMRLIRALPSLRIWPFTDAAAKEYGRVFAILRRMGRPMQQVDIQIASIALTFGNCTVVTGDGDFSAILGLAVEDWSVP